MEEFLKIFGGTWVFNREENLKKSMEDMKMPQDDINIAINLEPVMTIARQGDEILHRTELAENIVLDLTYKLEGKEIVSKDDKHDPPFFHNKVTVSFDGAKAKYISVSQLTGPRKVDTITVAYIKDGELITDTSPPKGNGEPDTSIVGRRIYQKKN